MHGLIPTTNHASAHVNMVHLSGPAIRKKKPIFEALSQIRANRVFSPIRIQIRVIRVQSSLLSIFWKVDSPNKGFFSSENRFAENIRDSEYGSLV